MTALKNDFEQGAAAGGDGTTVTTANSGGAGEDAFSSVVIAAGCGITYSTAQAAHGSYSVKLDHPLSFSSCNLQWALGSSPPEFWARVYLYMTAYPPNTFSFRPITWNGACGFYIPSTGKMLLFDQGTVHELGGAVALALNQWNRIETHFVAGTGSGSIEAKLFKSMDSTTPDDVVTSPATWTVNSSPTATLLGAPSVVSSVFATWMDDVAVATAGGYIGPVLPPSIAGAAAQVGAGGGAGSTVPWTAGGLALRQAAGRAGISDRHQRAITIRRNP